VKNRLGFVSNSSSASFVVSVRKPQEDLVNSLFSIWDYFSISAMVTRISENIAEYEKYLNEEKEPPADDLPEDRKKLILELRESAKKGYCERIKELQDFLTEIKEYPELEPTEEQKLNFIHKVLTYYEVRLKKTFATLDDTWEFSYWTSMFNNYNELPDILKEIVLMLTFQNVPMKCEVHHDG